MNTHPLLLVSLLITIAVALPAHGNATNSISSTNYPAQRGTYQERLQARRLAQQTKMQEIANERTPLTEEQMLKAIQQHAMDVIRRGETPLPVPLTNEQRETLVKEGFLPPDGMNSFTNQPGQ